MLRNTLTKFPGVATVHQQFEIQPHGRGTFIAKYITPDGIAPNFLRKKGWKVHTSTPRNFQLGCAPGLDIAHRARLPEFNFPLSYTSSQTIVGGKWYSPFMFIRIGTLNNQMSTSMYYEMKLEQKWEQIFAYENNENQGNVVVVGVVLPCEVISIAGRVVMDVNVANGVMWFKSFSREGQEIRVGLNL